MNSCCVEKCSLTFDSNCQCFDSIGIPIPDTEARLMELTFGSTHTVNPVSAANAFCDEWSFSEWDEEPQRSVPRRVEYEAGLSCLDDIAKEIAESDGGWRNFPALKSLLWERKDWDSDIPMIEAIQEECEHKEKPPCKNSTRHLLGPRDVETGEVFTKFNEIWKEKNSPLLIKREQLRNSFWDTDLINVLNNTWDRPPIKHVIMAYGVDIPTEVSYTYRKTNRRRKKKKDEEYDGVPNLEKVLWETAGGGLFEQRVDSNTRGGLADLIKKPKRSRIGTTGLVHGGDGSVPYISLSFVHTWLLHALRARKHESNEELGAQQILDSIDISHRPLGGAEWLPGFAKGSRETTEEEVKKESSDDTGTAHPHGTRYKPEMLRYHTIGTSRVTGRNYSTVSASRTTRVQREAKFSLSIHVLRRLLRQLESNTRKPHEIMTFWQLYLRTFFAECTMILILSDAKHGNLRHATFLNN